MRLLLDAMLGDLARVLRMCGHDAAYCLDRSVEAASAEPAERGSADNVEVDGVEADDAVLALAEREDRVLVTRDRELAERAPESVLVESKDTDEQLRELAAAGLDLEPSAGERCGACNGRLERVPSDADLPDYVSDDADPVWRCAECGQHFWRGSHWAAVEARLAEL